MYPSGAVWQLALLMVTVVLLVNAPAGKSRLTLLSFVVTVPPDTPTVPSPPNGGGVAVGVGVGVAVGVTDGVGVGVGVGVDMGAKVAVIALSEFMITSLGFALPLTSPDQLLNTHPEAGPA